MKTAVLILTMTFNDQARAVYRGLMSRHLFSLGVDAWRLDASEPELGGKVG